MKIKRRGSAVWSGGLKDGKGGLTTESGALSGYPYGFSARFEGQRGSNPEELIGAAHAGCFTMALSMILGEAGLTAEKMETSAEVALEKVDDGFAITSIHLSLSGKVPGATKEQFEELAAKAKAGCPVSKVLDTEISLDVTLEEQAAKVSCIKKRCCIRNSMNLIKDREILFAVFACQ